MQIYATEDNLTAWMTPTVPPANAAQYLRTASLAVTEATKVWFYTVDNDGIPTDATLKQAFNDATCAQAAAMITFGIDPLAGGVLEAGGVEQSVGIGSGRITYADAALAVQAQAILLGELCREADRILRNAWLQNMTNPWVVG